MAPVANASFSVIGTSGGLSTTTSVSLTVTATNQSFTLTANPATYTVAQGNPTDATINLTGTNGFNTPLTYACVEPATLTESTCTGPTGATANTTVSFHITTTHSTAELHRPFERNSRLFYAILMPGLLGILFVAGSRKRSRRGMRMLGLILVLAASTLWMGSCGGSSNSTQHNPGTPTGTYTITVNATTGGNTPVTGSTTFTLTVQ
jgi:hypothetical protein